MANEIKGAGTSIKIDTVTIARVMRFRYNGTVNEVDVSGFENISGSLVDKVYVAMSKDETIDIEGVTLAGSGAAREAGQEDLQQAFDAGTEVVLQALDANGYGQDYTSIITSLSEETSIEDVWKFSASLRINSKSAVTP